MRDYVLTAFVFALVPICLRKPWIGILAWYWLGIMNPHRHTWDFAFSMPFAAIIGGATLLGAVWARDRRPIPWCPQLTLVVILMLYFTFTTLFAWLPEFAWAQWKKVLKIVFMTVIATMFIYGHNRIRMLMWTIVLSIGFYAVKGFFFSLRTAGAYRVEGPAASFIDGNTFLGLAFNMVLPLMIFMAREEARPWVKRGLYFMAACTVISTIFTYSRGAYVGLAIVLPLIFLRAEKKVIAAFVLIPALLLAPFVLPEQVFERADKIENFETDRSANQRLQSWNVAWNIAKENPLTGAGFEFEFVHPEKWFSYANQKYMWAIGRSSAAHSIYFQVLGQHGFVALILFIALLISTMRSLGRTKKIAAANVDTAWLASYASAIQVALTGYMVAGAFLSSAYFDLAWLFFALSAILAREVAPASKDRYSQMPGVPPLSPVIPAAAQFGRGSAAPPPSGAFAMRHVANDRQ